MANAVLKIADDALREARRARRTADETGDLRPARKAIKSTYLAAFAAARELVLSAGLAVPDVGEPTPAGVT